MAPEYGLYHNESKEYLWLGKSGPEFFNAKDHDIVAFLLEHLTGSFKMGHDTDDASLPHRCEPGWREWYREIAP